LILDITKTIALDVELAKRVYSVYTASGFLKNIDS
jgi:hypothetical protein